MSIYRMSSKTRLDELMIEYEKHRSYISAQTKVIDEYRSRIKKKRAETDSAFDKILGNCLFLLLASFILGFFSTVGLLVGIAIVIIQAIYGAIQLSAIRRDEAELLERSEKVEEAKTETIRQLWDVLREYLEECP